MIEYFLQDLTMGMTDIVLMLCRIFFMTNSALKHTRLRALLKYAKLINSFFFKSDSIHTGAEK